MDFLTMLFPKLQFSILENDPRVAISEGKGIKPPEPEPAPVAPAPAAPAPVVTKPPKPTPPASAPAAAAPSAPAPVPTPAAPAAPAAPADPSAERVGRIESSVEKLTGAVSQLVDVQKRSMARTAEEELKAEGGWTEEKLSQLEGKLDGIDPKEYPTEHAKYTRLLFSKRLELQRLKHERDTTKRIESTVTKERQRYEWNNAWHESMAQAAEEYPDVADDGTPLRARATQITMSNPVYQEFMQATREGKDFDLSRLPATLQYDSTKQAYAELMRESGTPIQPPATRVAARRSALEAPAAPAAAPVAGELEQLEATAVKSGLQQDWTRYFTIREKVLRERKERAAVTSA